MQTYKCALESSRQRAYGLLSEFLIWASGGPRTGSRTDALQRLIFCQRKDPYNDASKSQTSSTRAAGLTWCLHGSLALPHVLC